MSHAGKPELQNDRPKSDFHRDRCQMGRNVCNIDHNPGHINPISHKNSSHFTTTQIQKMTPPGSPATQALQMALQDDFSNKRQRNQFYFGLLEDDPLELDIMSADFSLLGCSTDKDDEEEAAPPKKRQCRGLRRTKKSTELVSLVSLEHGIHHS